MRPILARSIAAALLASALASSDACAQFAGFRDVPYVYAQDLSTFRTLLASAGTQTLRLGLLGDSQETSPGGAGHIYIPNLQYQFYRYYGNVPESQIITSINESEFLYSSSAAVGTPYWNSRLAPSQILPSLVPHANTTTNGSVNVAQQYYGQLAMLQQDSASCHDSSLAGTNYMDVSAGVRAQVFAATNPDSGEVTYRVLPKDGNSVNYFVPVVQTTTVDLGLQSPTFAIKSFTTPDLPFDGKGYLQLEINGSDDQRLTDIVGTRFISNNPRGLVVQDFSAGGYTVSDFLKNHGQSGDMLKAFGMDAFLLHYGANDAGHNLSPEQFKSNTLALIAQVRAWYGDPDLPFILAGDPAEALSADQRALMDQYAGAQMSIAQADPHVLVLNTRRLADEAGWDAGHYDQYTIDGVHYTTDGARLLAKLEIEQLMSLSAGDANWDGVVNADDYVLLDRAYASALPDPEWSDGDFNLDGRVDQDDYLLIDTAYGQTHLLSPAFLSQRESEFGRAYVSALLGSVPEPAILSVLMPTLLLLRRSRGG